MKSISRRISINPASANRAASWPTRRIFSSLSGAGKSTLAVHLEQRLFRDGYQVYVLDGDNLRHGLTADLGFQPADREENIRRVGQLAALFAEAGFIVICAFISPYCTHRNNARKASGAAFLR